MALQIFLFGNPRCELGGHTLTIRRRKGMALLAYLARSGQTHGREAVATLFWPEQNRANALKGLRRDLARLKQDLGSGIIYADRQTIGINPFANIFLDVDQFGELISQANQNDGKKLCLDCRHTLEAAVELYTADFMAGFTLPDCPAFDEWQYFQTDSLRQTLGKALNRLIQWHNEQGEYQKGIEYGRRWLALDPFHEPAQRILMQLYAWSGQQSAAMRVYRDCVQLLDSELGVPPEPETTHLFHQIQAGQIADPITLEKLTPKLPPFLQFPVVEFDAPVFVSREHFLAQLKQMLSKVVAGNGQAMFIEGSAGRGKTALAAAFSQQAQDKYADLLVAWGHCNAFAGIGDPYLPFRDIMEMLSGDVEARLGAGLVGIEQASRLWQNLLLMTQTLLDHGPNLFDVLISHQDLLSRVNTAVSASAHNLSQYQRFLAYNSANPSNLEQAFLFQQVVNVLQAISEQRPLLLILDDLHWADVTSISLLFHLGRRLAKSPIFILGTYRPEDLILSNSSERHPLHTLLAEFKRIFGDVVINLSHTDADQGHQFITDFLDNEPNQLSIDFRQTLYKLTQGHPLFTVELLKEMQERGNLTQNDQGEWIEGATLNWELLPTRVEAVIEQRIGRLGEELRQILSVACVNGEEFSGQVVARVQAVEERQMLIQLSQQIARRHRLLREKGEMLVGDNILSVYQFVHALFQRYLYDQLSSGERRLLHAAVGDALESIYDGQTEIIAVQLARHFQEANNQKKARHYLRLAGEQAAIIYANDEAVTHFSQALALTPETAVAERFALLLAREVIYHLQGNPKAQEQDLATMIDYIQKGHCLDQQAEIALRRTKMLNIISEFSEAILAAKECIKLAQAQEDVAREAAALLQWGEISGRLSDYETATNQLERALTIAQENCLQILEGQILYHIAFVASNLGKYAQALEYLSQAEIIAEQSGDRTLQGSILSGMGISNKRWGNFDAARVYYEQSLSITREIGDLRGEGYVLTNLAILVLEQGDYALAYTYHKQAMDIAHEMGDKWGIGLGYTNLGAVLTLWGDYKQAKDVFGKGLASAKELGSLRHEALGLGNLGDVSTLLGEYDDAEQYLRQSLSIHQELEHQAGEAFSLAALGRALFGAGKFDEAAVVIQKCLAIRRKLGHQALIVESLAILARIRLAQEHKNDASGLIDEVLAYLDDGGTLNGTEEPLRVYLTCYHVLQANADTRALATLQIAYDELQIMVAKIPDEPTRCSMLENVPWHREIVNLQLATENRNYL